MITMPTISLCLITKNEEQYLEQCLSSVNGLIDEIIVVDTGSTDKTKEIAAKFTSKVFDFKWCDDFSAARNESLKHATKDWILVLDADETLASHDFETIKKAINDGNANSFILHQLNYTNRPGNNKNCVKVNDPKFQFAIVSPITRLFRNSKDIYFDFYVHESVDPSLMKLKSKVLDLPVAIHHYGELKNTISNKEKEDYYFTLVLKNLEKYPNHARSYFLAAAGYNQLNNKEKAIECCKKAIDLQPNNPLFESYLEFLN